MAGGLPHPRVLDGPRGQGGPCPSGSKSSGGGKQAHRDLCVMILIVKLRWAFATCQIIIWIIWFFTATLWSKDYCHPFFVFLFFFTQKGKLQLKRAGVVCKRQGFRRSWARHCDSGASALHPRYLKPPFVGGGVSTLHKWERHSWLMEKIKTKCKNGIYPARECVIFF